MVTILEKDVAQIALKNVDLSDVALVVKAPRLSTNAGFETLWVLHI